VAARARFSALYEENYDAVYAFCARRVGHDDAADATAEAFSVVWRRIDEVPSDAAVAWLYGVARGVVLNRWRSRRRQRRLRVRLRGVGESNPAGPESLVIRGEEIEAVLAALDKLRPNDKEILMMSAWDELTGPQIAQILGISIAAVDQRIHRAKRRLGKAITETAAQPKFGFADIDGERGKA
jgi:RNA polymerase sigma-70 factor (ECF subfamily)